MNWIIWTSIVFSIGAVLFIFIDSRRKRGTKVMIQWSKFIDDREISWMPKKGLFRGEKVLYGFNKFNTELQVEEFHLPMAMGKHVIEGLNPDDLEVTNRPYPKVHLVQIGETMFIPKKREDVLVEILKDVPDANKRVLMDEKHSGDTDIPKTKFFSSAREYLADKDVQGWAVMKLDYNKAKHAETKKGFDKYAPLIIPAVAMMVALIVIVFAINKAGDITAQANGEIRDSTSKLGNLVDNFIKNQNENNNQEPTDAPKPPAAQDSGGGS